MPVRHADAHERFPHCLYKLCVAAPKVSTSSACQSLQALCKRCMCSIALAGTMRWTIRGRPASGLERFSCCERCAAVCRLASKHYEPAGVRLLLGACGTDPGALRCSWVDAAERLPCAGTFNRASHRQCLPWPPGCLTQGLGHTPVVLTNHANNILSLLFNVYVESRPFLTRPTGGE